MEARLPSVELASATTSSWGLGRGQKVWLPVGSCSGHGQWTLVRPLLLRGRRRRQLVGVGPLGLGGPWASSLASPSSLGGAWAGLASWGACHLLGGSSGP